jgi:hypothetical protein
MMVGNDPGRPVWAALADELAAHEVEARLIARARFPDDEFIEVVERGHERRLWRRLILIAALLCACLVAAAGASWAAFALRAMEALKLGELPIWLSYLVALAIGMAAVTLVLTALGVARRSFAIDYSTYRRVVAHERAANKIHRGRVVRSLASDQMAMFDAYVRAAIEAKIAEARALVADPPPPDFDSRYARTEGRLRAAIRNQENSSRMHLALGVLFAIAGIIFFALADGMQLWSPNSMKALGPAYWAILIAHIVGLGSLQSLWIYFLWSHRRGHAEAKYYHTELTTIESKALAFAIADQSMVLEPSLLKPGEIDLSDKQMRVLTTLLEQFGANERHIVLKRGERSVWTQQLQEDRALLDTFARLWRSLWRANRATFP